MKKVLFSALALAAVFFVSGAFAPFQIRQLSQLSNFDSGKETRDLQPFKSIGISGGFEVVRLREGDRESVSIEAEGVELDKIVTEVRDGNLEIKMKKGSYHNCKIKIAVTYRSIKAVHNSGSSDIEAETPIRSDEFEFHSSGSGDFRGEFAVSKLEINISGSSDMSLRGKAEKQAYAISGSGDVDASKLSGGEAEVSISGSGNVQLNVSGRVRTSVSGSGHVNNNN